jgi:hypothetical protein
VTVYEFVDKNIAWIFMALMLVLWTIQSVAESMGRR